MKNDQELLNAIKKGDTIAFANLYHKYKRTVYVKCYSYLKNSFDAEETTQDIFLKVWLKKDSISISSHLM